eukprot:SAG22_NODE_528_length_9431_cov_7.192135_8_plen_383_part_00
MRLTATAAVLLAAPLVATAAGGPTKESKIKGALFGALVADALTLGTHYEYDAVKIKKFYGGIDRYYAPGEKTGGETHGVGWGGRNFHNGNGNGPPKKAGEQTDYGDYNILLLEHLAAISDKPVHRLDLKEFIPVWQQRLKTWRAWMCTQTKQTLQQVQRGTPYNQLGGRSNAMSVRNAATYGYFETEADIVHAAKVAMFTHQETTALEGGAFFAQVTYRVIHKGLSPKAAIEQVAAESKSDFIKTKVKQALDKAAEATDPATALSKEEFVDDLALTSMARLWDVGKSEPIKVGKASPTEGTLPGAIYFIVKYNDLAKAARANSEVGGDNASRSVAIGMVLGAAQGVEGVPENLRSTLTEWKHCEKLLDKLPLVKQAAGKAEL